nr:cytochrome c [uncultured Carboxylicivirga sp.]
MKKNLILILGFSIVFTISMSFIVGNSQDYKKKEVPKEFVEKENPYKGDESLKMIGLRNFNRHCVSCHGKKGKGDGVMAKNMKVSPGDLTLPEMDQYTDGEIYYLSFIGIENRPDFLKLIPSEEDKWAVVNFVRTLND